MEILADGLRNGLRRPRPRATAQHVLDRPRSKRMNPLELSDCAVPLAQFGFNIFRVRGIRHV